MHGPNLGSTERTLSIALGAALLINGLRKGGPGGMLQAGLGAVSLVRGASGHCAVKRALSHTPFEEQFQAQRGWKNSEAISRSITIGKPRADVFAFMREPQNVGPLMPWVESVAWTSDTSSRWTANAPMGQKLQATLQLLEEQTDTLLRWETATGSMWQHEIALHFSEAPANRGTEIKAVIVGKPAMGKLGYAAASAVAGFTDKALLNVLRSLKQHLETGEVSTNKMHPEPTADFFYLHPKNDDQPAVKTGIALEGGNL